MIAIVTRIGFVTGNIIWNSVLENEQPSIAAASSNYTGIALTNASTRNIAIGKPKAT